MGPWGALWGVRGFLYLAVLSFLVPFRSPHMYMRVPSVFPGFVAFWDLAPPAALFGLSFGHTQPPGWVYARGEGRGRV